MNAMLSGMSPGGLLSAATADCAAALGSVLAGAVDAITVGAAAVGVPAVGPAVGRPELHPATSATSTTGTENGCGRLMPATLGGARPAPGQRKVNAQFAVAHPRVQSMRRSRIRSTRTRIHQAIVLVVTLA